MEKKDLPVFDELDLEFSRNSSIIYDILTTNFNKRISLIEASRNDIFLWLEQKLKGSKKWEIRKSSSVEDTFPKSTRDGELKEFRLSYEDDIGIYSNIDITQKSKPKNGIRIEIGFGLEDITWYIGQFSGFEFGDEFIDYKLYKRIINSIASSKFYEVHIVYPGVKGVDENDEEKWIEVILKPENMEENLILEVQKLIKTKILAPILAATK